MRARAARRRASALSSRSTRSRVEVEEGAAARARRAARVGEQRAQRAPCVIGRPPSPAIDGVDRAVGSPASAMPHVGRDDAADADGERLLEHDDALGACQRRAHRVERERPERA